MGENTSIEWTQASWNPIRGCSRVSEGCRHCYAERTAMRFSGEGQPYQGLVAMANGHPQWTGKVAFIEKHLNDPLKWKEPRRIFVNSMSDLFHDNVEWEWFLKILHIMMNSPRHTFQVLTKRPKRMAQFVNSRDVERIVHGRQTSHIHWGTSIEDQDTANERLPELLKVKWGLLWASIEPIIGGIDLERIAVDYTHPSHVPLHASAISGQRDGNFYQFDRSLQWIVAGSESGPGARPAELDWYRSLRDQCVSADVPFFLKQFAINGKKIPTPELDGVKWTQYPQSE